MALKFQKLTVWQKALDLTAVIHELSLKFPKEELYILTAQIKRAGDSIALNIAEGSQGQFDAELNRFLGYAIRYAVEVVACLHIAHKRKLLNTQTLESVSNHVEELIKMLQAFRRKIKG